MTDHLTAAANPDEFASSCAVSAPYDIFINLCDYNYCSRDVNTFATELCSRLESRELQVFLDKPDLRDMLFDDKILSKIEDVIVSASVHIAIFPPNFAQSKWSLDELVLMIKSSIQSRTTIIPIFYYVKPSELRWTGEDNDGAYGKALFNYEKKNLYDPHTIKEWRDALSHVTGISGFVLEDDQRSEEDLLNDVVESVFKDFPYGPRYDVFINHRGPDVKETFATDLYNRLRSCGFRVFLDKPEFIPGLPITPQIEVAIQYAHVNIAIFSPNYAQSRWCLDELNLMVKSRNTILPVFYKVKCSGLGCPEDGVYAEALHNHKNKRRCDSKTLEDWRNALYEVAKLPGYQLDGNEEELLDKIVRSVKEDFAKRSEVVRSSEVQSVLKSVLKEDVPKQSKSVSTRTKFEQFLKEQLRLRETTICGTYKIKRGRQIKRAATNSS